MTVSNKGQSPKAQSYLLNEPIQDSVSFSAKNNKKEENTLAKKQKRKKVILWVLGGLGIIAVGIAGIKIAENISTKRFFRKFDREAEEKLVQLEKEFDDSINDKKNEQITKDLKDALPEIDFSNKLSDIVENIFEGDGKDMFSSISAKNVPDESLRDLYAKLKKEIKLEKDPTEIEKNKQATIFLLSKIKSNLLNNNIADGYDKYKILEKKIYKITDELINTHFNSSISKTEFIPDSLISKIKHNCSFGMYAQPNAAFTQSLNETAEELLKEIKNTHIKDNKVTDEGKKLLSYAEILNNKAAELSKKTQINESKYSSTRNTSYTKRTINNFKEGNFKSGYDQFWDDYFNNSSKGSYSNNKKYTNTDIQQASIDTFKKYGEDLGNINDLTEEKITKAYRKLSMKYHPDKNPGNEDATKTMQSINYAMEGLRTKFDKK